MPRGWCRHVARNMSYKRPKTQPGTSHELLTAATLPPAPLRSARSEGRVLQCCRSLGCLISTGVAVNSKTVLNLRLSSRARHSWDWSFLRCRFYMTILGFAGFALSFVAYYF